jgi:hypothetical protein
MSLQVPTREIPVGNPPASKRRIVLPLVIIFTAALLGGAGWYYFFGRKPKVSMTVALEVNGNTATRGLWSAGPGELLLAGDGDVTLIDLASWKRKWIAQMPQPAPEETARQAAVNARFVRLQQWADDLSRKRVRLTNEAGIQAFNAEAAKYHAELDAARAEVSKPQAPVPAAPAVQAVAAPAKTATPAPAAAVSAKSAHVLGGDRAAVDALHPVVDPGAQILEDRIRKRSTKLLAWKTALDARRANAKTPFQKSTVTEEEARYAAELAEQKKDEDESRVLSPSKSADVAELVGPKKNEGAPEKPSIKVAVASLAPEASGAEAASPDGDFGNGIPMSAICSDRLWIIEGRHAVAFDRGSGGVKADVRLAGPARRVFADGDTAFVVASAGSGAVQVTKLGANAKALSSYFSTGHREDAFALSGGVVTPNVQGVRTEFSTVGGSLLRVEIRLKEKSIRTGAAKERVDDSTYEIALSRPFEPEIPEWSGMLRGRVQVFSTPSLHLVTAGAKLLAFDRANKKAWEAVLGGPVPIRRTDSGMEGAAQPWLEAGGRLFFADGASLTAFDVKTGRVAWRFPSVGIRKITVDGEGSLYVLSDNLHAETLTYVTDANLRGSASVAMRINPADGKIRWQAEGYQDLWASGTDVYALREAKDPGGAEKPGTGSHKAKEALVKICKLSRGGGGALWEWFQPRRPQAVEVHGKNVALLFGDELQIIRSICW